MPCGKEEYFKVSNLQDPRMIMNLCNKVLADKLFGFLQADIHVLDELLEKCGEFSPLFIINEVLKVKFLAYVGLLYTKQNTDRMLKFDWLRASPYACVWTGIWTG